MKFAILLILIVHRENVFGNILQCDLGRGKKGFCVPPRQCSSFKNGRMYFPDSFCMGGYSLFCCDSLKSQSTPTSTTTTTTEASIPDYVDVDYKDELEATEDQITFDYPRDLFDMRICGNLLTDARIAGGINAKLLEFPWVALIGYGRNANRTFSCGGSLISANYVMTASHCLVDNGRLRNAALVRLGEHKISTIRDCDSEKCADPVQDIYINSNDLIVHENYTRQNLKHDIALIRLREPARISQNNIKPICLPFNFESLPKKMMVIGFGRTENSGGQNTDILMKVNVDLKDKNECSSQLKINGTQKELDDTQICAGGVKDSCKGDSGSSLHGYGKIYESTRLIQYGIVSFGAKFCGSTHPGVYTNVESHIPWIIENIRAQT